jgi:hypothetical protein
VAGSFGDAAGVRQLGQALQAAGRGVNSVAGDLSGQVKSLVPDGWSGDGAGAFSSDWTAKAAQSAQLAAVCNHVGQVLIGLAGELDAANQKASSAQQMTGGPASRFALPSTEQKSQQLLSQASGAAQQAQAAARAKLAGIAVPKIGPPLTVSQVTAWAGHLAPPQQPWYDTVLHDIGSFFGNLFSGRPGTPPPKPPLSNAHSFVQVSPHVWVPANDPKLPELKAAWAWASKRPVYLSGSPGETEFTRWVDAFTVSPYASDLNKGGLGREFGSFQPDYRVGGAFNQHQNVILTTAGMGAAVFFGDPRSLIGASKDAIRRLVPDDWSGPQPLKKGVGEKWTDGKGNSIMIEEGDPHSPDLGQPDSALHRGDFANISENGIKYRIALDGNPALSDPNAATLSIKGQGQPPQYINEKLPQDVPGDELGGDGGGEGDGGGGDGGAAGE